MARTLIVGDVHGCLAELRDLLDRLAFSADDRLCFVGDLVARGPDSAGVLDLIVELGGRAVRGNHEDKLLRYHDALEQGRDTSRVSAHHQRAAATLRKRHWTLMRELPYWLDLPEHEVRIIHGGLVPSLPIEKHAKKLLLTTRGLDGQGHPTALADSEPWGTSYQGPPHVVFGHNAKTRLQFHSDATGIDLGCVYGGYLAALVLPAGQRVPPRRDRREAIVFVPARRAHFPISWDRSPP